MDATAGKTTTLVLEEERQAFLAELEEALSEVLTALNVCGAPRSSGRSWSGSSRGIARRRLGWEGRLWTAFRLL
jgi:hypothetical protein